MTHPNDTSVRVTAIIMEVNSTCHRPNPNPLMYSVRVPGHSTPDTLVASDVLIEVALQRASELDVPACKIVSRLRLAMAWVGDDSRGRLHHIEQSVSL